MTINEFDLSIGNIVSLGGVIAALLSIKQVPVALCFLIAALICLLVGCVNGIVVARFQILSFITTLGMGTVLDGVIYGLTGGTTVFNGIPKAFTIPGILKIAGIPFITLVAVVLYLAFYVFMGHTAPGRKLYAIGGSRDSYFPLPGTGIFPVWRDCRSRRCSGGFQGRFCQHHCRTRLFSPVLCCRIYRLHRI